MKVRTPLKEVWVTVVLDDENNFYGSFVDITELEARQRVQALNAPDSWVKPTPRSPMRAVLLGRYTPARRMAK